MIVFGRLGVGVTRVRRWLRRHRRPTAAALLATAAGLTAHSVAAEPAPGVPVTVVADDLPAGHVLAASDLRRVDVPTAAAPDGVLDVDVAVGRTLSVPARRGEPVTDARLTGTGRLVAAPPGTVAMTVPLSSAVDVPDLQPGDAVRVVAGSMSGDALAEYEGRPAEVLVDRAVVLEDPSTGDGGLLGSSEGSGLLLAVSTLEALRVADAVDRRWIGVVVLP